MLHWLIIFITFFTFCFAVFAGVLCRIRLLITLACINIVSAQIFYTIFLIFFPSFCSSIKSKNFQTILYHFAIKITLCIARHKQWALIKIPYVHIFTWYQNFDSNIQWGFKYCSCNQANTQTIQIFVSALIHIANNLTEDHKTKYLIEYW